jgi:hypothetical protein
MIVYSVLGESSMQCSETGSHEAVQIDLHMNELQRIDKAVKVVRHYAPGHGTGEVVLKIVNGALKLIGIHINEYEEPELPTKRKLIN